VPGEFSVVVEQEWGNAEENDEQVQDVALVPVVPLWMQ
jgi:hypothetical protein